MRLGEDKLKNLKGKSVINDNIPSPRQFELWPEKEILPALDVDEDSVLNGENSPSQKNICGENDVRGDIWIQIPSNSRKFENLKF